MSVSTIFLAHIINSSLQTSEIPSDLKLAKVISIFKLKKKESDLLLSYQITDL